jgi:hypothetical protein
MVHQAVREPMARLARVDSDNYGRPVVDAQFTLCMKGILRMASGPRSRNTVVSRVVVRRPSRADSPAAGLPPLGRWYCAPSGSAKARVGATAAGFLHNPSLKRTRLRRAASLAR